MSKRLDSLNTKKPATGPKPTLKFKPKTVARKSKEERAKDAPEVKDENVTPRPARGRGNIRGRGRGGRANYAGTHVVSSGPLASGSVSMGNVSTSKTGYTQDRTYNAVSPTPEFLQKLKLKDEPLKPKVQAPGIQMDEGDSDDDDITKINMNKGYRFSDEETILFPVRPGRREQTESPEGTPAPVSKEATPQVETVPSREPTVKSEPIEEKLEQIKAHKAELESKMAEPVDSLSREEYNKILDDHQHILDLVTDKFDALSTAADEQDGASSPASEDKFILFHLPKVLPHYETRILDKDEMEQDNEQPHKEPTPNAKSVDELEEVKQVKNEQKHIDDDANSSRTIFASDTPQVQGQIGHLNIHKSGKITINLGNDNNLAVAQGVPTDFLQELAILDMDEEQGKKIEEDVDMESDEVKPSGSIFRLGEVDGKIIATPLLS